MSFLAPAVVAHLLAAAPLVTGFAAPAESNEPGGPDRWIPIDEVDGSRVPAVLASLPKVEAQAYEAASGNSLLFVRRIAQAEIFEAFITDEDLVASACDFVPVDERAFETDLGEGTIFDCEVAIDGMSGIAAAMYAPDASGGLVSLWILHEGQGSFDELAAELHELLPHHQTTVEPRHRLRGESIVLNHRVAFDLVAGAGENAIELEPVAEVRPEDYEFFKAEMDEHATFKGGCVQQWEDAGRGVSLSYQVLQGDTSIGLKEPLLHHIAEELQKHERISKEEGDIPIELVYVPGAQTVVVSEAEVARHYENNRRAPEAGVILQTYIPRSPFARATRLRWREGTGENAEHVLALYIELRSYPRSRSETIARTAVVMLQARGKTAADLALLERELSFESQPIEAPAPFAPTP